MTKPKPKSQTLGESLRARRRAAGLSVVAMAERLHVNSMTIYRWEWNAVTCPESMQKLITYELAAVKAEKKEAGNE